MEEPHPASRLIAEFSEQIRSSTINRFRSVHPEDRGWRMRPDLLSFADVLQHLVDADRWLFGWLDGRDCAPGVVIAPGDANPAKWDALLDQFSGQGGERSRRIAGLSAGDFSERQFDLGPRGIMSLSQLILRCNIDHEIHHRGAVQLSLRLRYG